MLRSIEPRCDSADFQGTLGSIGSKRGAQFSQGTLSSRGSRRSAHYSQYHTLAVMTYAALTEYKEIIDKYYTRLVSNSQHRPMGYWAPHKEEDAEAAAAPLLDADITTNAAIVKRKLSEQETEITDRVKRIYEWHRLLSHTFRGSHHSDDGYNSAGSSADPKDLDLELAIDEKPYRKTTEAFKFRTPSRSRKRFLLACILTICLGIILVTALAMTLYFLTASETRDQKSLSQSTSTESTEAAYTYHINTPDVDPQTSTTFTNTLAATETTPSIKTTKSDMIAARQTNTSTITSTKAPKTTRISNVSKTVITTGVPDSNQGPDEVTTAAENVSTTGTIVQNTTVNSFQTQGVTDELRNSTIPRSVPVTIETTTKTSPESTTLNATTPKTTTMEMTVQQMTVINSTIQPETTMAGNPLGVIAESVELLSTERLNNTISETENTTFSSNITANNTTVESVNTTVESVNTTVETGNTIVESGNKIVESGNTTVESVNTTVESRNTIVESGNKIVESGNTTVEIDNTIVESGNTTVESRNTTMESHSATIKTNNTTMQVNSVDGSDVLGNTTDISLIRTGTMDTNITTTPHSMVDTSTVQDSQDRATNNNIVDKSNDVQKNTGDNNISPISNVADISTATDSYNTTQNITIESDNTTQNGFGVFNAMANSNTIQNSTAIDITTKLLAPTTDSPSDVTTETISNASIVMTTTTIELGEDNSTTRSTKNSVSDPPSPPESSSAGQNTSFSTESPTMTRQTESTS